MMKTIHRPLLFIISLFVISSCSSAPEDILEITINNTTDNQGENSANSFLKLDYYFQLNRGNNYAEGAAVFGDYLFQASLGSELHIYNFAKKEYITTIKLASMGHADTMCFGTEKVDENDEFPALYISGSKVYEEGKKGDIYVYRILREKDEQGTENWSGVLIQRIKTPDVAVIGSYPDIVIDEKENCMWIIGFSYYMMYMQLHRVYVFITE